MLVMWLLLLLAAQGVQGEVGERVCKGGVVPMLEPGEGGAHGAQGFRALALQDAAGEGTRSQQCVMSGAVLGPPTLTNSKQPVAGSITQHTACCRLHTACGERNATSDSTLQAQQALNPASPRFLHHTLHTTHHPSPQTPKPSAPT